MIPNKDRSKLPAPPLGHATGHGLASIIPGSSSHYADDATIGSRSDDRSGGMFPPINLRTGGGSVGGEKSISSMGGSTAGGKKQRNRAESILGTRGGGSITREEGGNLMA